MIAYVKKIALAACVAAVGLFSTGLATSPVTATEDPPPFMRDTALNDTRFYAHTLLAIAKDLFEPGNYLWVSKNSIGIVNVSGGFWRKEWRETYKVMGEERTYRCVSVYTYLIPIDQFPEFFKSGEIGSPHEDKLCVDERGIEYHLPGLYTGGMIVFTKHLKIVKDPATRHDLFPARGSACEWQNMVMVSREPPITMSFVHRAFECKPIFGKFNRFVSEPDALANALELLVHL